MKLITVYDGPKSIEELTSPTLIYSWSDETKLPTVSTFRNLQKVETELLEITLHNSQKVICPFTHIFYTFRGENILAQELKIGQSIRAYTVDLHKRDGHLRVFGFADGKVKHQYVARMVWEYYNGEVPEGMIIHHRDFNKLNNTIDNFELLDNSQHNSVHYPYRRDGGFYRGRNHKVVSITEHGLGSFYFGEIDDSGTFIVADDTPLTGVYSGVVSKF